MSTTIVLTKEIFEQLFPEGSEARVRLANAAISGFAQRELKASKLSDEAVALVGKARQEVLDELLKMHGMAVRPWGGSSTHWKLNEQFEIAIRKFAQAAVEKAVEAYINKAINDIKVSELEAMVERTVEGEVTKIVRTRIQNAIEGVFANKG